jgi:VWFA-related protein
MRRLILLAVLAATAFPAGAAKRLTVAQLEQSLSADSASHRPDADIARRVGGLELSERLTEPTLDRFAARIALGPRTALALRLLADQSAFLDPPEGELPATAAPDAPTQQRMLDAARGYVVQTVPRLPNFFATRTTNRFDDSPQVLEQGGWPVRGGLHPVGAVSRKITFRDGKEVQDAAMDAVAGKADPKAEAELGLHTWGEFGPELSIVLADIGKGKAAFSHWEQTQAGLAAVYRYSVPKSASHYAVSYCCIHERIEGEGPRVNYAGRNQYGQSTYDSKNVDFHPFSETPGYRGSLSIDPATGAVLRVTLEAELGGGDPLLRAATVVEYGPVTIGEQSYICPVRSLAFSMAEAGAGSSPPPAPGSNGPAWTAPTPILLVNETSFTEYHRLGSTIRMLAEAPDASQPNPADANSAAQPPPEPASAPASASPAPRPEDAGTQLAANAAPPAPGVALHDEPPAPIPAAPLAPPAPPAIPEVTMGPADGVPDLPANESQAQDGSVTLKLTSRLVDIGVVAYDKKGHPVKDLKQEDFEVYDNGRKQEIRFFSQFSGDAAPVPAPGGDAAEPAQSFSNRSADPAGLATPASASETNTTILLIDESHIAWADMNNARQQVLKFLSDAAPGERIGLYTMTGLRFRVLAEITTDHAALAARLGKWLPTAQSVSEAQDEEMRNRQQFNEVRNVADLNSVNGNHTDVPDAEQPVDPQLLTMGDNPARASLVILTGVARHLSAVPGHKSLVWISSDNVFADFRDQAVGIDKSSKYVDSFALHAQEAMNDAHVAVYPFDVSQLETAAITADMQHRNVELTQAAMDTATVPGSGGAVPRNSAPGRITAEMDQDLHPIQGPIRQVADATGGRTIRRSGDLANQLNQIVAEGHTTYMIGFHPDVPADDKYHILMVKLTGKHGLTLRYRTGYMYAKEPSSLRERFQQAVWRPTDANEVAVTAGVDAMKPGAYLKINIAASDLGLEQRGGRWMDKLDIFFIQRDDAGIHAQVDGQTLGLRLRSATYQNLLPTGVPFEHLVRLKPGTASLRVLVVDENSGRMGSVTIPGSALSPSP